MPARDAHEPQAPRVLIVDDDPDDVMLIRAALLEAKPPNDVVVRLSGESAWEMLSGREGPCDPPDLILLDFDLQGLPGREVLRLVRADPRLAEIPVVVMSRSGEQAVVEDAYRLRADAFIQKTPSFAERFRAMQGIDRLYLGGLPPTPFWPSDALPPKAHAQCPIPNA